MTIGSAFMNGGRVALSWVLCSLGVVTGSVSSLVFVVPSVEVIVEQNNATRRHSSDDASADKEREKETCARNIRQFINGRIKIVVTFWFLLVPDFLFINLFLFRPLAFCLKHL